MALKVCTGRLKKQLVVKMLGQRDCKLLARDTVVKFYRHPTQLGLFIIEWERVYFARIDAANVYDYVTREG